MVKRKKDKGTNKDLQNTTQKTAERATQTPLKSGDLQIGTYQQRQFLIIKQTTMAVDCSLKVTCE